MQYTTFNPETQTVTVQLPWETEPMVYTWLEYYARQFVNDHLHYNGRFHSVLSDHEAKMAYYLCDGFGPGSVQIDIQTGKVTVLENVDLVEIGYDWSHVRDSSDEAIMRVARYIAGKWVLGSIEALAQNHLDNCAKTGCNPLEVL